MKITGHKFSAFVRSRTFFIITLVIFLVSSVWIALSARYPMAFDEGFHLGIIKIYAHQWSPFLSHQPPGSAPFGALTTDPSYLYHYLMSFPYHLLTRLLTSEQSVIIALRFINIGFFAGALILMRNVLSKTKASMAVVHATLLFFVLLPIVPLLAGQINYDNLVFLLLATNLLLVIHFREQLQRKKQCNAGLLLHLTSFALLGSLVKFAYLPFLLAIVLYMFFVLWRVIGSPTKVGRSFWANWRSLTKINRLVASLLLMISATLFVQRYGVDVVKYHNIVPQCGQVLDVQRCSAYGPWARNYALAQTHHSVGFGNPVYFAGGWLYGMFNRTFFAINGPGKVAGYDNKSPLPVMTIAAALIFGFGVCLIIRYHRYIFKNNPVLLLLLFTSFVYLAALIGRNYHDYTQLGGQLVAINGRYLLLIILPILLAMAMAYERFVHVSLRPMVLPVACLLMLQGGSAISFIYYSTPKWYWPHDSLSLKMNSKAKSVIRYVIIGWPN